MRAREACRPRTRGRECVAGRVQPQGARTPRGGKARERGNAPQREARTKGQSVSALGRGRAAEARESEGGCTAGRGARRASRAGRESRRPHRGAPQARERLSDKLQRATHETASNAVFGRPRGHFLGGRSIIATPRKWRTTEQESG